MRVGGWAIYSLSSQFIAICQDTIYYLYQDRNRRVRKNEVERKNTQNKRRRLQTNKKTLCGVGRYIKCRVGTMIRRLETIR